MMHRNTADFHDLAQREESLLDAVLAGLSRRHKAIPCKFLYDERGSQLFDAITRLPEYYPTRTEMRVLEGAAEEIADLAGSRAQLIEFGSGSSLKVRILLEALDRPSVYVPIDVSREHLREAADEIAADLPDLAVVALCADYTRLRRLPHLPDSAGRRVGFFPGSTIGNLEPDEAVMFLAGAAQLLGRGSDMIVGVDLKKDQETLEAAYNDGAGVTADFILNLLVRVNRELGADFDLDRFAHLAFWNEEEGRIEIYLESLADQTVHVAGRAFRFAEGERIHAEHSYKYSVGEFRRLAGAAGFRSLAVWTDPAELFSVHYLRC
jgi:L-histidine Nalpha-methyltransferase